MYMCVAGYPIISLIVAKFVTNAKAQAVLLPTMTAMIEKIPFAAALPRGSTGKGRGMWLLAAMDGGEAAGRWPSWAF